MRRKAIRILIAVCVIAAVLALGGVMAIAADLSSIGLDGEDCALTIYFAYPSADGKGDPTAIPGAELTVYKVAELTATGYAVTQELAYTGVEITNDMQAAQWETAAKTFAEAAQSGKLPAYAAAQTTGADGLAEYDVPADDYGIFLVVQTGATGEAAEYNTMKPFLVQVPEPVSAENGEFEWNTQVRVLPKPEEKKPAPEEPTPAQPVKPGESAPSPKTGDNSKLTLWCALAAAALCVIVTVFARNRRDKSANRHTEP